MEPSDHHRSRRRWAGTIAALALSAGAQAATDITSLSLEQLLDVRVVGASKYEQKQAEVAAAVSVITRAEIRAFGWRTLDRALASLPGVYTTYDRQYAQLGTRGFGVPGDFNTRLLVMINGNRVNDPVYDGGPVGTPFPLDMDLVERIEYIPGPGSAVYGQNAMFGVVNVVTRDGAGLDGVELAGSWQQPQHARQWRASAGRRLDNGVDVLVSASGLRARGEDRRFDFGSSGISGVAAGLDAERIDQLFFRAGRGPWSFDLAFGDRNKADPTGGYFSDPLVAGQYQRDRYVLAQWQIEQPLAGDSLRLQGRVFAGSEEYRSVLIYGTPLSFPATGQWHGAEARLVSTALADHKLMVGLEWQRNSRVDQAVLDLADSANDIHLANPGSRTGLFVQDEWRIAPSLAATFGWRVDRGDSTPSQSSPRAALLWQAAPGTLLKALVGRAHRDANAYERYYDDRVAITANPSLRGERIDTIEFVGDQRVDDSLGLRASIYDWRMRDLVTLGIDPVSGLAQYRSGSPVSANGLELAADKTWPRGVRLRASVSLQHARRDDGSKLVNSPEALGRLNLSAPVAGALVGYELRYDGPRLSLDGTRLPGFAVSNLHLSSDRLWPGVQLSMAIDNLFDKRYAHPAADTNWQNQIEQDGRSVRLTLGFRF